MQKAVSMCLNWKVIGGLAAVGLGVWIVAPDFVGVVLPVLVLAACPLSMLLMPFMMRDSHRMEIKEQEIPASTGAATPQERLRLLKEKFAKTEVESKAIVEEIAQLESLQEPSASEQDPAPRR